MACHTPHMACHTPHAPVVLLAVARGEERGTTRTNIVCLPLIITKKNGLLLQFWAGFPAIARPGLH